jgi:S1-C subfamily serine protease
MNLSSAIARACLVLFAVGTISAGPAPVQAEPASVVRIVVWVQNHDPFMPWQKQPPTARSGYGAVIGPGQILTVESLLRNRTLVEVLEPTRGEKIPCEVVTADPEANVALLRVADGQALQAPPLRLASRVPRDAGLTIMQFDETRGVLANPAQTIQIGMEPLPEAPYPSLVYTLLADSEINGRGAPVILRGKLAGLIMGYDRGQRTGNMLPIHVLQKFLDDVATPPYEGFASAGFLWAPLVDPAKRSFVGANPGEGGILVLQCLPGTDAFHRLKPNDVILEWDGYAIDNLGFYADPDFGRISFPYLVRGRRAPGETVPVRIIRQGQIHDLEVTLTHHPDSAALIPENILTGPEPYLIEGGLIIRELTGFYLRAHGPEWQNAVDSRLVHQYLASRHLPEKPGQRVVILSTVLPDDINTGYQHIRNAVITHVNGTSIDNLRDIFRIRARDGTVNRISLQSIGIDLVLDRNQLQRANERIQLLYRIPALQVTDSKTSETDDPPVHSSPER